MHSLCSCSCIHYIAHNRAVRSRHAIILHYSNMSCRKDQRKGSSKQAGSSWSARYCWLATSGGNLYPPGVWFADAMSPFSAGVTLVLFRFHIYAFIEAAALRPIVLRYAGAPTATRISSFSLLFLWSCRFFRVFPYHCRFIFVWRVRCSYPGTFFPSGQCFSIL